MFCSSLYSSEEINFKNSTLISSRVSKETSIKSQTVLRFANIPKRSHYKLIYSSHHILPRPNYLSYAIHSDFLVVHCICYFLFYEVLSNFWAIKLYSELTFHLLKRFYLKNGYYPYLYRPCCLTKKGCYRHVIKNSAFITCISLVSYATSSCWQKFVMCQ